MKNIFNSIIQLASMTFSNVLVMLLLIGFIFFIISNISDNKVYKKIGIIFMIITIILFSTFAFVFNMNVWWLFQQLFK
jgi:hypothetical protein